MLDDYELQQIYNQIAWLVVVGIVALLLVHVVKMVREPEGSAGFFSQSAFHGFRPKNKQKTVEMIIEQKDGKKMEEQEGGEGEKSE